MKSKTIAIAFFLPLLVLLSGVLVFLLLPFIADRYIIPNLTQKLPFDQSVVSISRFTPWSARGTLALGDGDQTGISVARFEAYYSPSLLLQGRIARVLIDAAVIHLQIENNRPFLRGLSTKPAPSPQKTNISLPVLPLRVDRIDLKNVQVIVHAPDDRPHFINVDAELIPAFTSVPDGGYELHALKLDFSTWGALQLKGELAAQPQEENQKLRVRAELANLSEVLTDLAILPPLQVAGKVVVDGHVLIEELRYIGEYSITVEAADFNVQGNGMEVGLTVPKKPAVLQLSGDSQAVKYDLTGLEMKKPERVSLEVGGLYDLARKELAGSFQLIPDRIAAPLLGEYQGKIGEQTVLGYTITGEGFSLKNGIEVDNYSVNGDLEHGNGSFAANMQAAVSAVALPEEEISLRGISVDLPFNFPPLPSGTFVPGNLLVEEVRYKDEQIASIKGGLSLEPEQIVLNTQTTSPFHENFSLVCSSSLRFQEGFEVQCNLPQLEFDTSHVPGVVSLPDGLEVNGKIAAMARYSITNGVHKGDATIIPSDVQVTFNDYSFSGINGSLKFPRLPVIQSSPSQLFTVENIDLGKLRMSDAKIFMRVDDSETLFVEEARLRWSGGRVEAGALKLHKDMDRLETRLYCDRLSYTELLDQFGVGDAEGGGSLNGRLPIVISRNGVEFDDGFLFSTPGDSGIVRFSNTKRLRQGMAGMDKTSYLDYSMDALENFAYNWTKLTFNTEGEELLLTLQLDGKPAQPLPYGYRNGQIVKTDAGQGIQHPLRLDVNFRLPMRDLLHYGKSIQSLMENM